MWFPVPLLGAGLILFRYTKWNRGQGIFYSAFHVPYLKYLSKTRAVTAVWSLRGTATAVLQFSIVAEKRKKKKEMQHINCS